jgi:hypothetical protein
MAEEFLEWIAIGLVVFAVVELSRKAISALR